MRSVRSLLDSARVGWSKNTWNCFTPPLLIKTSPHDDLRGMTRKTASPLEMCLNCIDSLSARGGRQQFLRMNDIPHRIAGSRIRSEPGNNMPMNVRKLIAQQFVIDFVGTKDSHQCLCH